MVCRRKTALGGDLMKNSLKRQKAARELLTLHGKGRDLSCGDEASLS
jgi:hypothetical protein